MALADILNNPQMGLAMQLLAQSGYSQQPMSFGQRMGQAGLGFAQQQQKQQTAALQKRLGEGQLKQIESNLKERDRKTKIMERVAKGIESGEDLGNIGKTLLEYGTGTGDAAMAGLGIKLAYPGATGKKYKFTMQDRLLQLGGKIAGGKATTNEQIEFDLLRSANVSAPVTAPIYRDLMRDFYKKGEAKQLLSPQEETWIKSAQMQNKGMSREEIIKQGRSLGRIR